jgi:hypothetical protein
VEAVTLEVGDLVVGSGFTNCVLPEEEVVEGLMSFFL